MTFEIPSLHVSGQRDSARLFSKYIDLVKICDSCEVSFGGK